MKLRLIRDKIIGNIFLILTLASLLIVVLMAIGLFYKSYPILEGSSFSSLFLSEKWKPFKSQFGFLSFIMGTIWVTVIAIAIALPLSLFASIYLSEYANSRVKKIVAPLIDLLSGIPPVIYGVWGMLVIVPFIQEVLAPHFVEFSSGYSVLAGGIILAVMIFPLIISILQEVFASVPKELTDASLSLGSTQWQAIKYVLLKKALPGIIAAIVLAISRAFGETIAVLMVCGNVAQSPHSIFDSGYPLPALIANNYGEMLSVPLYESALMLAAFILFGIIFLFNTISRVILYRLEKSMS